MLTQTKRRSDPCLCAILITRSMIAEDERQDEDGFFQMSWHTLSLTLSEIPHEIVFGHIPESQIIPPFMTSDIIYIYLLEF